MHELSIAVSLVDIAAREATEAGSEKVSKVRLRIGALSGVVRDALEFSFDIAAGGTIVEGAALEIEELPVVIHCPACDADRELPGVFRFRCPVCDTPSADIRQGKELEITSLEIQ
jgi:hydrogenase nickel incorporation protein HypA/HybF